MADSERRKDDPLRSDETTISSSSSSSSSPESPNRTGGLNVKSILAEFEKRRVELFGLIRSAEARAREAEEKYTEAETRLDRETDQRQLVEKQLRELEEEYLLRLSTVEAEETKRLEAEMSLEKAEAQLKDAEARVKEAEERAKNEAEARRLAEEAQTELEEKVEAAVLALADAERKRAEAEAEARAAEDNVREIEALIGEAETIGQEANNRYKTAEARMQQETELRDLAEKKLKALEDELSSYLELDWSKVEPDIIQSNSAPPNADAKDPAWQFEAQVETEKKARLAAEKALASAEAKVFEVEDELRKAEEKHRQAEAGLKNVMRKQESELRSLSEQVARSKDFSKGPAVIKSGGQGGRGGTGVEQYTQIAPEPIAVNTKIKLATYSAAITLLLVALCWLVVAMYLTN